MKRPSRKFPRTPLLMKALFVALTAALAVASRPLAAQRQAPAAAGRGKIAAEWKSANLALRSGNYAKAETLCQALLADKATSSSVLRQAAKGLVQARAIGGRPGLDQALATYRTVFFGNDAPTTRALVFCDAMKLRHALASGDMATAAAAAQRVLAWGTANGQSAEGETFVEPEVAGALYEFYSRQHGAQAYSLLMARMKGPERAMLALARFDATGKPEDALPVLKEVASSGCPSGMRKDRLSKVLRVVDKNELWKPSLGKRGYYEILSAAARNLDESSKWLNARELLNRRATQMAIELRNDRLAGIE